MDNLNENVLKDDYPVHYGYSYVADGKVIQSDIQGTVSTLKRYLKCEEIRNCDIFGRKLLTRLQNGNT
jgi:hypothetical protein